MTNGRGPTYEDVAADLVELLFDLLAVLFGHGLLPFGALRLLLDGRDDSPGGPASADDVLVGDGQQVALLVGQLGAGLGDGLHAGGHVVVALGLFGQLGALDLLLLVGHGCGGLDFCRNERKNGSAGEIYHKCENTDVDGDSDNCAESFKGKEIGPKFSLRSSKSSPPSWC